MTQLRVIAASQGIAFEGGRQISYLLDGSEATIEGENAKNLIDTASASMGMLGDLPWVLAEFLELNRDEGKQAIDAAWMTRKEYIAYQASKGTKAVE